MNKQNSQLDKAIKKVSINESAIVPFISNLIQEIPIAGSVAGAIYTNFQNQKRTELLNIIKNSSYLIPPSKVSDIDFIMELKLTIDVIDKLTTNEKIKFIGALFNTSIISVDKINTSEYEEFLHRIRDLSARELELLSLLYEHNGANQNFYTEAEKRFNLNYSDTRAILQGCTRSGFCYEVIPTGMYFGQCRSSYFVTDYFKKFLNKIQIISNSNEPDTQP